MHKLTIKLLLISLFVALAAMVVLGMEVLLIVFAGVLFAVFIRTISRWLVGHTGLTDRIAVIIVCLALFLVIGGAAWASFPALNKQFDELFGALPKAAATIKETLSQFQWGRALVARAPDPQEMADQQTVVNTVSNALRITSSIIAGIIAIIFLGVFFALSPGTYVNGIIALFPRRLEPRAREILDNIGITLDRWLRGQLFSMAIVFVSTSAALWMMDVRFAVVLGLIAGLLAFIPNIGPVISVIPAAMVGLLDSPARAGWIIVAYIVIQTIESNIITPIIQKKMVDLPEALVLATQLLMGVVLGSLALILATPLSAMIFVMVKMIYVEDVLGRKTMLPEDHNSH